MSERTLAVHDIELAKGLGFFSIGLGLTELFAGGMLSRILGLGQPSLVRAFGARELAAGIYVLASPDAPAGVWARVGGDVLDLAVLGSALGPSNRNRGAAMVATLMVAGVTALDVLCATSLNKRSSRALRVGRNSRYRPPSKIRNRTPSFSQV